MPTGRDTEEFEKFVQNLVKQPASPAPGPMYASAPQVTINGAHNCRIYIAVPGATAPDPTRGAREQPKQQ